MTTIVTRVGKGELLTFAEVDANFTNLNNDKVEVALIGSTSGVASLDVTGKLTNAQIPASLESFNASRIVIASLEVQTLDAFPYTQYGAAKYIIYAASGADRQICELLLTHDGTTVLAVEYANLVTSVPLGTFSTSIINGFVTISVDPTTIGTHFQVMRTLLKD